MVVRLGVVRPRLSVHRCDRRQLAIALRDAIGRMAHSAAHGEPARTADLDLVNLYAATPDIPPTLAGGSRQAGRSVQTVGQALSTIARSPGSVVPAPARRARSRSRRGAVPARRCR